jgi:hypothetical protein
MGGTKDIPLRLPMNVKGILKQYSPLPKGDPKKIGWIPYPVDKAYRFEPNFFAVSDYSSVK